MGAPSPASTKSPALVLPSSGPFDLARNMKETTRDYAMTKGVKVENCIGFAKVPVGLAGPLTINGENQQGSKHCLSLVTD